jgi:ABC-type oligopeptide transport system substrate-binding subunit
MRISTLVICAFAIAASIAIAGCGHKLVAHNGESTVAVYPDENTFTKLSDLKKQGGVVGGMIGGIGEGLAAKQVDNNTPVRIINSDDKGSQIEVLDGAFKGTQGFVPSDNLR